jgi:hypothetical protein
LSGLRHWTCSGSRRGTQVWNDEGKIGFGIPLGGGVGFRLPEKPEVRIRRIPSSFLLNLLIC